MLRIRALLIMTVALLGVGELSAQRDDSTALSFEMVRRLDELGAWGAVVPSLNTPLPPSGSIPEIWGSHLLLKSSITPLDGMDARLAELEIINTTKNPLVVRIVNEKLQILLSILLKPRGRAVVDPIQAGSYYLDLNIPTAIEARLFSKVNISTPTIAGEARFMLAVLDYSSSSEFSPGEFRGSLKSATQVGGLK